MHPTTVVSHVRVESDALIAGTTVARRMSEVASAREVYLRHTLEAATVASS